MDCPKCGGPCFDNRQKKASGQYKAGAPDFACKDKDGCGWKQFPPKGQQASNGNGNGSHAPVPQSGGAIGPIYNECFDFANKAVSHYLGERATPEAIVAATATLFIEACRSGRAIRAAKPAPPPPPPPPPVPTHNSYDDSDWPF